MKYTKKVSLGKWLKKGEDFKEGDVVEIASEGDQVEGQYGMQDVFLIKLKNKEEGNVSLNTTSLNSLIDGYGEESLHWIGKPVKIMSVLSNVQGKMIRVYYFLHPDAELDEETGQFLIPGKEYNKDDGDGDVPVFDEDELNKKL